MIRSLLSRNNAILLAFKSNCCKANQTPCLRLPLFLFPLPKKRRFHATAIFPADHLSKDVTNLLDWFSPVEYENPWDSTWLQPLDYAPADYATRHLIQLLQELHQKGAPRTADRVTTERCNHTIQQLLQNNIHGGAHRADAILQTMQLFHDIMDTTSNQQLLPMEIPKPNRETYNTVLQLYSRTPGPRSVPDRAQQIMEQMEWRYQNAGEMELKPHSFHLNCVLLAWKECDNDDKAVHAAKVLFHNKDMIVDENDDDDSNRKTVGPYITLLRICAHNHPDEKAALLGANVAIKLWQQIMETVTTFNEIPDLPSHFYAHFLQAVRNLPSSNELRERYFDAGFGRACEKGKVNPVVLHEFLVHAKSGKLFRKYLAQHGQAIRGLPAQEAAKVLFQAIPKMWKEQADDIIQKDKKQSSKKVQLL